MLTGEAKKAYQREYMKWYRSNILSNVIRGSNTAPKAASKGGLTFKPYSKAQQLGKKKG